MNLLSLIIFAPIVGVLAIGASLAVPMAKPARDQFCRWVALISSGVAFVLGLYLWVVYDGSTAGKIQFIERFNWIPSLHIEYFVGVDGISVSMVILSTLISFIATIASMPWWRGKDEHDDPEHPHFSVVKVPGYMTMLLILQTGMSGTFAALDMFLFFVFWEVMLLPMYFLIGIWGGPRKEYAAIKFFLYTLGGSVLLLLAIIALYYRTGDPETIRRLAARNRRPAVGIPAQRRADRGPNFQYADHGQAGTGRVLRSGGPDPRRNHFQQADLGLHVPGVRGQGPDGAVSHLVTGRSRRSTHSNLGNPGRNPAQDGHLRHAPDELGDAPRRYRILRRGGFDLRGDQHRLCSNGLPGPDRSQEADRLLLGIAHGLQHVGNGFNDRSRNVRRGPQPVHPRNHQPDAVLDCRGDLRPGAPPRDFRLWRNRQGGPGIHRNDGSGLLRLVGFAGSGRVHLRVLGTQRVLRDPSLADGAFRHRGGDHRRVLPLDDPADLLG